MLKMGEQLEGFDNLQGWSENDSEIIYQLDFYCFIIKKSDIQQKWGAYEIVDLLKKNALKQGCNVFSSYKELPFGNHFDGILEGASIKKAEQLTDYMINSKPSIAYEIIKETGLFGFYQNIIAHVFKADEIEQNMIFEGKEAIMSEVVHATLFNGTASNYDEDYYSIPLIIDFKHDEFPLKKGEEPFFVEKN